MESKLFAAHENIADVKIEISKLKEKLGFPSESDNLRIIIGHLRSLREILYEEEQIVKTKSTVEEEPKVNSDSEFKIQRLFGNYGTNYRGVEILKFHKVYGRDMACHYCEKNLISLSQIFNHIEKDRYVFFCGHDCVEKYVLKRMKDDGKDYYYLIFERYSSNFDC